MNYLKNYNLYIEYVKTLKRNKNDGVYYELHHILPKSLGGLNLKENLVLLTAREHYLAHYLLWKIYKNKETAYAFHNMNTLNNKYKNSRLYEKIRIEVSSIQSKFMKENNPSKKYPLSQEHRKKIGDSQKGENHWMKRRSYVYTQDHKNKIGSSCRGLKNGMFGKESYMKGKTHSLESIEKMRKYKWWTDGIIDIYQEEKPGENFRRGKSKEPWNKGKIGLVSKKGQGGTKVCCIETKEVFESISIAASEKKTSRLGIRTSIKNKKSISGMTWIIIDNEKQEN
jgi:hypothetical protein